MSDPILLDVQLTGTDAVVQQANAMGAALGQGFAAPSADVEKLNASIAALAATITKLGTTSTATVDQVKGVAEAGAAFEALVGSVDQFQAKLDGLSETFAHLGDQSQEAGKHIHEMGEAGSAAGASFKLLQTSATGAVEILTGGGLRAGISVIRELGEGVEATGKHFGVMGEEIGKAAVHFGTFAALAGGIAAAGKELADVAKEDTLAIHSLATALGVGEAQILQLKSRFADAGVSADELAVFIRSAAVRMQDAWADIQRSVRDATLPIIQDQLAIQAAERGTEEAQVGLRESAMDTAQAQMQASGAQGEANRAAAEAQINASEAVIHQKEAELDAQYKLADAQRAYADAVVNANEAQMNFADAQNEAQYAGQDAWRKMEDAIDAVADAERKAADEATAVQEAMLSVAEAATGVKSAYVSLYAAQLAYREAHGGGKITKQERQEMRREQTEVGLESAQERVQAAQFQYARTARDAVPEAEERQKRAERDIDKAREEEEKAAEQLAEASERAADKIEKAGSAAAAALERVAKAALQVELAPQKAEDETAKAALDVEGALASVRKTQFEATQATARAEDALERARLKEAAAADATVAAETALSTARNKEVDDLNNNINAVRQYLTTGRGPPGFDIRQTPPGQVARAAEFEAGGPGHFLDELNLVQKAFQNLRIPMEQWESVMTAMGAPRGMLTGETGGKFREQFLPAEPGRPAAAPFVQVPTELQQERGATVHERVEGMEQLEVAERKAASATRDLADDIGTKLVPTLTKVMNAIAQSPGEATAVGAVAAVGTYAATQAVGAVTSVLVWEGGKYVKRMVMGGPAAEAAAGGAAAAEAAAGGAAAEAAGWGSTAALLGLGKKAAVAEEGAAVAGGAGGLLAGAAMPVAVGVIVAETVKEVLSATTGHDIGTAKGVAQTDIDRPLLGALDNLTAAITGGHLGMSYEQQQKLAHEGEPPKPEKSEEAKPPAAKPEEKPEKGVSGEVIIAGQKGPVEVVMADGSMGRDTAAAKADDISQKLIDLTDKITESKTHEVASSAAVGGDKMTIAADKLEGAAIKLDMAAEKMGGGASGAAPEPGRRTEEGAKDAIDKIKDSIDKLVSGKGLIQPPTEPYRRAAYDADVAHLLESITEVNRAQAELIGEQTRATAENEKLTREQENLTAEQADKIREEASDEAQLTQAQIAKLTMETQDEHEIALAQEDLIHAQADAVRAGGSHAAGGLIFGAGGPTQDNIPIMASAGEYVVNAASTSKHRSLLDTINSGGQLHFQLGGFVQHGGNEPSTGAAQAGLTGNIGMGPGGYMMAKMQNQRSQSYEVDLRTDHGTFSVLATDDQMATLQQSAISSRIASTGFKPSWWS